MPSDASTLRPVRPSWDEDERAALVALLRTRPKGMSWETITAEVDTCESAIAVWESLYPPTLLGDEPFALSQARQDISAWRAADYGFLTFLDEKYPAPLRAVHDLPPVLFHRGTLVTDDVAVSVVAHVAPLNVASPSRDPSQRVWSTAASPSSPAWHEASIPPHTIRPWNPEDAPSPSSVRGITRYYPPREPGTPGSDRRAGATSVTVLARCGTEQARVSPSQLGDVRIWPRHDRHRGR